MFPVIYDTKFLSFEMKRVMKREGKIPYSILCISLITVILIIFMWKLGSHLIYGRNALKMEALCSFIQNSGAGPKFYMVQQPRIPLSIR
jgi:predicted permease